MMQFSNSLQGKCFTTLGGATWLNFVDNSAHAPKRALMLTGVTTILQDLVLRSPATCGKISATANRLGHWNDKNSSSPHAADSCTSHHTEHHGTHTLLVQSICIHCNLCEPVTAHGKHHILHTMLD